MTDQAKKWHTTRNARIHEIFNGKQFTIVKEVNSKEPLTTPLGYKINRGYNLKSTDGTMDIYVGKALLSTLADLGVVEKPTPKRRGRPRKQPIIQAEEWAGRDIPDNAQEITQAGPTYRNPNANEEA